MRRLKIMLFSAILSSAAHSRPVVTSTTNIVADLVLQIGAEDVEARSLMGAGVDPHLYKASSRDLVLLREAELIFYNGLHLEGKLGEILSKLSKKKRVVAVASDIPNDKIFHSGAAPDPHIWFDPEIWKIAVANVTKNLSELLPEKASQFEKRRQALNLEIDKLVAWGKSEIKKIPVERRVLVTSHDAFRYFGRAFGLEVLAVQGLSTESEAGLKDLQKLVETIKERKIVAVFVESSVPKAAIERVKEASGAKLGGELYSDALGSRGSPAASYIGMLRHNIQTIVGALK